MTYSWRTAFTDKLFRRKFLISIILLALVLTGFYFVLGYAEKRQGLIIEKGWLNEILMPRDFSFWIFSFTYSATILGLLFCFRNPLTTLLLIRTYLLIQLLRAIVLLIFPLNPPEGIIPLDDPFLHSTFYAGRPNLKDLFFSGHVATLVMFILIVHSKWLRPILIFATCAAGILLILQRVHYISDVVAAPFFAFVAYYFVKKLMRKVQV
ncbi:hypothetical protein BH09BAC5_BH09BAC5_29030 [soil metagenome]